MKYSSKKETLKHIKEVRENINIIIKELKIRAKRHDRTKLNSPEIEIFDKFTPKLKNCTYGSDEYKKYLDEMQIALQHHYFNNRHHPEFFTLGPECNCAPFFSALERMTLVDLIEMVCDWYAATKRHTDGDILKSCEINQKRFGYGDELSFILKRTASLLEEQKKEADLKKAQEGR